MTGVREQLYKDKLPSPVYWTFIYAQIYWLMITRSRSLKFSSNTLWKMINGCNSLMSSGCTASVSLGISSTALSQFSNASRSIILLVPRVSHVTGASRMMRTVLVCSLWLSRSVRQVFTSSQGRRLTGSSLCTSLLGGASARSVSLCRGPSL